MTAQAHLFGESGRTDAPADLKLHEVDYTPPAVAVQLLLAFGYAHEHERPRILDCGAGSGCWSRAARAVFPGCYIVGVDPRESERKNLEAACDEVFIGTLEEYLATNPEPFDLIIGNPPFSAFSKHFWPGLLRERGLLRPGGTLGFYGLTQWGQSTCGSAHLRTWSPSVQYRVGGRIEHRGEGTQTWAKIPKKRRVPGGPTHELRDNGGDSKEYSAWVWHLEDLDQSLLRRRPSWTTDQLLELPPAMRKWNPSAVPGTYPIDPALVAEIRARYL